MVDIFGKSYYIDLDGITDKCRKKRKITPDIPDRVEGIEIDDELTDGNESQDVQAINIFKYELIKLCIERILMEDNETDEKMGAFTTIPISFKIAFNTLIKNEILIEEDDE